MNPATSVTDDLAASAVARAGAPQKRRYRSKQERRLIVEESLAPGTSVARVARAHEVNANQVHYWRKLYQQGLLDDGTGSATLLPVRLSERPLISTVASSAAMLRQQRANAPCGAIEIEAGRARVRIAGTADPTTLRVLLEHLLG